MSESATYVAIEKVSPLRRNLKIFMTSKLSTVAASFVIVFVGMALFAPWIAPHDPNETDLFLRLQPPAWIEGGDISYLLGCDGLGRDILSRIIYGARISIFIGVAVIVVATSIGIIAGLAAGYLRGWVDITISRLVDILVSFPYLIFAIALIGMIGAGLQNIILVLVLQRVGLCRVGLFVVKLWLHAKSSMWKRRGHSVAQADILCCVKFCQISYRL